MKVTLKVESALNEKPLELILDNEDYDNDNFVRLTLASGSVDVDLTELICALCAFDLGRDKRIEFESRQEV